MAPPVTVLIPTHDHGPTLRCSVASALGQEGVEVEVLIVGDGMPAAAGDAAREVAAGDERVRVFEFEKGPRHGELHRAKVLAKEVSGEVILYLSDDDLWLPEHAKLMARALDGRDFAAATTAVVAPGGRARILFHDVGDPGCRELMLDAAYPYNRVPLSCVGHTMRAYRELTPGWQTSPDDVWTDLHFMRGFLASGECRATSVAGPTVLHFPSPDRGEMTNAERVAELAGWWERIHDPAQREQLRAELEAGARLSAVELELEARRRKLEAHHLGLRERSLRDQLGRAEERRAQAEASRAEAAARLGEIEGSRSWRVLERARRVPGWQRMARGIGWGRGERDGS